MDEKWIEIDLMIDSALVEEIGNGPSIGMTDSTEETDESDDDYDAENNWEPSRVLHFNFSFRMILDSDCVLKLMRL